MRPWISSYMEIQEILQSKDKLKKKALFQFSKDDSDEAVVLKFNLWSRYFFGKYFTSDDASFHNKIDKYNLEAYRGKISSFTDIAFRGAAKTARAKLFIGFVISNDTDHSRRYLKVLSADGVNSKQIVTDVYNMLVNVNELYPEIFVKTDTKREETMTSFTTATGIKMISDTVGSEQRGAIQEDARPDFIWYEDFENRRTLRSLVQTKAIWDNMEEARTGLSKGGSCIYTCNYISEMGNVHKLVLKRSDSNIVLIVPIEDEHHNPAWDRYTKDDIQVMRETDEDFEGERLCKPSASRDVMFDRERLDSMLAIEAKKEVAGFRMFKDYDPSHRYGSGHDVAGGVGLDSSTSVFIDFDTIPAQVVGTFHSNTIQPESFGYEIYREGEYFGLPIAGIENNKYDQAILAAKNLGAKLYRTQLKETIIHATTPTTYGWNTNSLTKSKMIMAIVKAVNDGLISLNDADLIQECKSYTRNDLIDEVKDIRLTTRHFDLLIGLAIAWQMKDYSEIKKIIIQDTSMYESKPRYNDIGI